LQSVGLQPLRLPVGATALGARTTSKVAALQYASTVEDTLHYMLRMQPVCRMSRLFLRFFLNVAFLRVTGFQ
jgi:hypothetical protein